MLKKEFGGSHPTHPFLDLERYEVLILRLTNGLPGEPFFAQTLPPLEHRVGQHTTLIRRLQERFSASRAVVERKLDCWIHDRDIKVQRNARLP